jgi:cell fate regulator YaaT (PSP1 superfamily)
MPLDEARAHARARFKDRLQRGEPVGGCECHDDEPEQAVRSGEPTKQVVGVRFRDSGRTFYFDPRGLSVQVGDWVVVETTRGREAGRVIIAAHQIRISQLQGDLKPLHRRLGDEDVRRMEGFKKGSAEAVRTFKDKIRQRNLPLKAISAEYNFDGSLVTLNYTTSDKTDVRDIAKELASELRCRVELKQVGPRDEARLLGGLGRCGRTLCCSSWLPVYPEISMSMAKTQELSLNPQKVSGVCGRLLCCLSYENEQYKQMKVLMPRLGQTVETPQGPGLVVSLQVLKELVTVRMAETNADVVFATADLGFRKPEPTPPPAPTLVGAGTVGEASADGPTGGAASGKRRRRRRRAQGAPGGGQSSGPAPTA